MLFCIFIIIGIRLDQQTLYSNTAGFGAKLNLFCKLFIYKIFIRMSVRWWKYLLCSSILMNKKLIMQMEIGMIDHQY